MRWLLLISLIACGSDAECTKHGDCPDGHCSYRRCKPGIGNDGDRCDVDSDCLKRHCVRSRCASGDRGAACYVASDCGNGLLCGVNGCGDDNVGLGCDGDGYCRGEGVLCIRRQCARRGGTNAACDSVEDCLANHACMDNTCLDAEGQRQRTARLAEENRKHAARLAEENRKYAAAEEARMLEQSGVKPVRTAEKLVHPPGAGQRVRTATAQGNNRVFAACRVDERLVGGGCDRADVASFPSEFSASDTVGARWNCNGANDVTAYALCAKLP